MRIKALLALIVAGLLAVLIYSQVGGVRKKMNNHSSIPYASAEIKEKLAKCINPGLTSVPEDFFETLDYSSLLTAQKLENSLSVLNSQEEKLFWQSVMSHRTLTLCFAIPSAREMNELGMSSFGLLAMRLGFYETPAVFQANPELLAQIIRYEELHPFNFPKYKANIPAAIQALTREEIARLYPHLSLEEVSAWTDKELEQAKNEILETLPYTKVSESDFNYAREEIQGALKDFLAQIQSKQTPEEYANEQNRNAGVAEYTVHFQAPPLYPAELFFAAFLLSPSEDGPVYQFPKLFLVNELSVNKTRLENEKPLPYKLAAGWYSIAENKIYSLATDLPRWELAKKLIPAEKEAPWDSLLFTLEPYGKVTLYAFNQVTQKKEQLAVFRAEETEVDLSDFRSAGALYESPDSPAKDWREYQQKALAHFEQAAENLKNNGLPAQEDENIDFGTEGSSPRDSLPPAEEINKINQDGYTPLVEAVRTQKMDLANRLIAAGADVNLPAPATGDTPLSAAAAMGHLPFVKTLLAAKADVNARNTRSGRTPLMEAVIGGRTEAVRLLLDAGADPNLRVILNGQEYPETALTFAENNDLPAEIAALLREAGAEEPQAAVLEQLSSSARGNAAEAYASMGLTPLHQALLAADTAQLKDLLASGADVNAQAPNMGTPLLYACISGNTDAAKLLLAAGADANAAGDTGYTPLMMAVQTGNTALVKTLIEGGADVNAKHVMNGTETGLTPLTIALDAGSEEIAALLRQAGAQD